MNSRTVRIGLLLLLSVAFVVSLAVSTSLLPERVATHFNLAGKPDGWMSRTSHLIFMGAFGLIIPAFIMSICWATRFLPAGLVNIPHREYWLSDEHRAETASYLAWHSVWLGCLLQGWLMAMHWMVVLANQKNPAELPFTKGLVLIIPFLAGVMVWVVSLCRHFRKPESVT